MNMKRINTNLNVVVVALLAFFLLMASDLRMIVLR
jgi:hypothetical protein